MMMMTMMMYCSDLRLDGVGVEEESDGGVVVVDDHGDAAVAGGDRKPVDEQLEQLEHLGRLIDLFRQIGDERHVDDRPTAGARARPAGHRRRTRTLVVAVLTTTSHRVARLSRLVREKCRLLGPLLLLLLLLCVIF